MRRITPDFTLNPASLIWPAPVGARATAAIAHDYAGGDAPAQIVIAFESNAGKFPSVRTLALTVPESALLADDDDTCHCSPTPDQLVGYPIRGTIRKVDRGAALVTIDHEELPGILDQGTDTFRADRELAASLRPDSRCLARIERRNGEWRIFDVRLLAGWPR